MSDNTGVPRSFAEEIREVMADLHEDFGDTILDTDPTLEQVLHKLVVSVFETHGQDGLATIRTLKTLLMWMLLVGREHHARGYGSPLPRDNSDSDVPDFLTDWFNDEEDGQEDP